ncbi:MAG: bifunctional preprotein translocase subunit SecD/SecF [Methanocella sp. PtaU1.Bin125]|nr:MAG: bifunctional preprotein translocase subunit SecD/SecF [Methanocella sp. PtaU1.Bin125]
MFREWGTFVTRHPYAVLAVWLVVLVLSVPLVLTFSDRLTYSMDSFIPKDLESIQAQDIYNARFPDAAQSQIIVAIKGDPGTAMAFVDRLNQTVNNGSIPNVTSTTSVYEVQRNTLANVSPDLHTGLHDLYDNVTDASRELYNATDDITDASRDLYYLRDNVTEINSELCSGWATAAASSQTMYGVRSQVVSANAGMYQLQGIADVLFGVPNQYAVAWNAHAGTSDGVLRMAQAYGDTYAWVGTHIPPANQALAYGYLQGFNATWNAATPTDLASARAAANGIVTGGYADGFINSNVPADQRPTMLAVRQALTISAYNDPSSLMDAIVTLTLQQGGLTEADRPRFNAIYSIGPSPSAAAIDSVTTGFITAGLSGGDADKARDLYACGNNPDRIWEYVLGNAIAGQNNSTVIDMIKGAWGLGRSMTNESVDRYVLDYAGADMNESERQKLAEIYAWGPRPDASVVSRYVLDEAGKELNESEAELIAEVYGLGRDPSEERLRTYTVNKVNEDLNLEGNLSYLYALLDMDRNTSKKDVEAFARGWAVTHDFSNPQIMPAAVVEQMAKGNLTLFVIGLTDNDESQAATDAVITVRDQVKSLLSQDRFAGLEAYVTGSVAMSLDAKTTSIEDVNNIDKISVVLILVLLCLYFRSFVTPIVPLAAAGTGIVVCFGGLWLLAGVVPLFYLIMTICMVIMLGACTDYNVFMLSRYSEERALGRSVKESVITAVEHSGKSVASSGITAMIGFGALLLVDRGIFGGIGIGLAMGILVSLLVALSLLPAVMTIAGDRLFWPRKVHNGGTTSIVRGIWSKITRKVLRHSKLILVLALIVCVPAVYFTVQLELGSDYVANMPPGVESKMGFDAINEAFGSGSVDKVMILMTLPQDALDASGNVSMPVLDRVENISAMLSEIKGVDQVYSMTRPDGETINYADLSGYPLIEREYYESGMKDRLGNDNRTIVLHTSFLGSPYSVENSKVIEHIRENMTAYAEASGEGTTFMIGGAPAGLHDYQSMVTAKYNTVYVLVLIGVFVVLMVLLRSVFTPLRLIMTLLASVVWTIAAYVIVFQVMGGVATEWMLPIFLFCALMGLGVDYDIFLVSRIREEVMKGKTDEEAIEHAVEATGTIITLCGAVMASAFGSMMISSSMELKEFGFVLCVAIILDATLMRLVIVPAIMVLMKKYNWWMPFMGSIEEQRKVLAEPKIKK